MIESEDASRLLLTLCIGVKDPFAGLDGRRVETGEGEAVNCKMHVEALRSNQLV